MVGFLVGKEGNPGSLAEHSVGCLGAADVKGGRWGGHPVEHSMGCLGTGPRIGHSKGCPGVRGTLPRLAGQRPGTAPRVGWLEIRME